MFQTDVEFLEHWEVFLSNIDKIGFSLENLEDSVHGDMDDFLADKPSHFAFQIENKELKTKLRISENSVKLFLPIKYWTKYKKYNSMNIVFYEDAIKDQSLLIEYLQANIMKFTSIFEETIKRENDMQKNLSQAVSKQAVSKQAVSKQKSYKYKISRDRLNNFYINSLDKEMPFVTFEDSFHQVIDVYDGEFLRDTYQFLYFIDHKKNRDFKTIFLMGFFNEDFEINLYYQTKDFDITSDPDSYKKFPLTLQECADPLNRQKFKKAVYNVVNELNGN